VQLSSPYYLYRPDELVPPIQLLSLLLDSSDAHLKHAFQVLFIAH
jgi:hypothetical protein